MARKITQSIALAVAYFISITLYAGTPKYGEVLYRINAGGVQQNSLDNSPVVWATDNSNSPCQYIDIGVMGNRTYGTTNPVTLGPTVPSYVPQYIFNIERNLFNTYVDSLEYHFPVPYGTKVEVRLYFAEIYFNNIGDRKFDIYVENQLKLKDYDILTEVGKNIGVMKSYQATSDGTLNIFLMKVKNNPKINGIEIIEIEDNDTYYRVNAGGVNLNGIELTGTAWAPDNMNTPSTYLDTTVSGNRTFEVFNQINKAPDVPSTTPMFLFKSQRVQDKPSTSDILYEFPVAAGQKVDVRLYFAELYFDLAGERVMDIYVEDVLALANLDLIGEKGKYVGTCKEFTIVSDGSIKIRIAKVTEQPIINGIEIVESTKNVTITSLFNKSNSVSSILPYPNPFIDETSVKVDKEKYSYVKVVNFYGQDVSFYTKEKDENLNIVLEGNPNGIYYLLLGKDENSYEKVKLMKY